MTIKDQALKKLFMGLEKEWSSHATMRQRATEIIESLALQLEAKGDHTEEYKRGFKDGVVRSAELAQSEHLKDIAKQCASNVAQWVKVEIDEMGVEEFKKKWFGEPIGKAEIIGDREVKITLYGNETKEPESLTIDFGVNYSKNRSLWENVELTEKDLDKFKASLVCKPKIEPSCDKCAYDGGSIECCNCSDSYSNFKPKGE